jgi:type II secretory pathway component PulM
MTEVLVIAAIVLLLAFLVWFVGAPLRRGIAAEASEPRELRALEAAREAKYSEIRDTELDYRTGKLSDEDFRALDRQLRAEAVEILRRLDELR